MAPDAAITSDPYSEDVLESALMELLGDLGFEALNGHGELDVGDLDI